MSEAGSSALAPPPAVAVSVDDNSSCRYHDAVAGACGEIDVVPVRGGAVVPPRYVVSNVPADTVHSLAGAVRACGTHKL